MQVQLSCKHILNPYFFIASISVHDVQYSVLAARCRHHATWDGICSVTRRDPSGAVPSSDGVIPLPCSMSGSQFRPHVRCTSHEGSYPVTSWVYKRQDLPNLGISWELETSAGEIQRAVWSWELKEWLCGTSVRSLVLCFVVCLNTGWLGHSR